MVQKFIDHGLKTYKCEVSPGTGLYIPCGWCFVERVTGGGDANVGVKVFAVCPSDSCGRLWLQSAEPATDLQKIALEFAQES